MSRISLSAWLLVVAAWGCAPTHAPGAEIRRPAVQGQFYPADPAQLRVAVRTFLEAAPAAGKEKPLAIVSPHAGYTFSGQICADAFSRARGHDYDLVVVLGTNHTVPPFQGVALYPGVAFRTPLGDAEIDQEVVAQLVRADARCKRNSAPHVREHSIEVQIPFIQHLFPEAKIVAAVVGSPDAEVCGEFGRALAKTIRGRNALVVSSCDLSHYPEYDVACRVDGKTLEAIVTLDPEKVTEAVRQARAHPVKGLSTCACGEAPVLAGMAAARELGATHGLVVSYANSGDTLLGDGDRVVGYGAVAFYEGEGDNDTSALRAEKAPPEETPLREEDQKALLAFARKSIDQYLRTRTVPLPRGFDRRAQVRRGAFVTLKKDGRLRGCIGHMVADSLLPRIVGNLALQAAFGDRRFPSLRADELPDVQIEISVLTPAKEVSGPKDIVVGRDGVVLSKAGRRAVFLPQVATEQGWNLEQMLDQLCRKAGLPAGSWKEGATLSTFQAEAFHEAD